MSDGERTPAEIAAAERKAAADADKAELEAAGLAVDLKRKEAEFGEWQGSGSLRDADASAKIRTQELANEASERDALKDLVPDLGEVDRGSVSAAEGATILQTLLGGRALQDAARKLIPVVKGASGLGDNFKVLVTTDLDLAARDVQFHSVVDQLERLTRLVQIFSAAEPRSSEAAGRRPIGPVESAAALAAKVLPGLLGMLSSKRTITVSSGTVDDEAALVAVAGALAEADPGALVVVERASLPAGESLARQHWGALDAASRSLSELLEAKGQQHGDAWVKEGRSLLKTCESALTAMVASDGVAPSPLAKASLHEALQSDAFMAVLIVKGGGSSTSQLINDRPLMFNDKVSIVASATISYLLIDHHQQGKVIRGGLAHGVAQVHGSIGNELPIG